MNTTTINLKQEILEAIEGYPFPTTEQVIDLAFLKLAKRIDEVFGQPNHGILDIYEDIMGLLK